jgi:hypothetical protein
MLLSQIAYSAVAVLYGAELWQEWVVVSAWDCIFFEPLIE